MKNILISLTVLILAACNSTPNSKNIVPKKSFNWNNESEISQKITITNDPFKKIKKVEGPYCPSKVCNPDMYKKIKWADDIMIRGWVQDDVVDFQIYGSFLAWDWMYLDHAFDSNGNKYDLVKINNKVQGCDNNGCSIREDVGINLTKEQMELFAKSGLSVMFYGTHGKSGAWNITPEYFKAMLNSI